MPSREELDRRNTANIHPETISNITSTDFPYNYPGEAADWNTEHFRQNFHVNFHKHETNDAVFSLIGIDASVANALRRILLAEIPTLAIEDVFIEQNTSIIQDEVLAHRLGLVPLKGNRDGLRWLKWRNKGDEDTGDQPDVATDFNTVVLKLQIECDWKEGGMDLARRGEQDAVKLYENTNIYARHLKFEPVGQQVDRFSSSTGPILPVHPDILLAKLRPGHKIDITMHAVKGIGADHAKFSPVATASYRLLPVIDIVKPILGADAKKFARCFPKGVIGLEKVTSEDAQKQGSGYDGHEGETKAVVQDAMRDTVSRECLRHEEFAGKVKLGRRKDHFIFSVESTGQMDSDELFLESIKVLRRKCEKFLRAAKDVRVQG